jgi:hypothetical protein
MEDPSKEERTCSPDRRTVGERESSADVLTPGMTAASGAKVPAASARLASRDCRAVTEGCRCNGAACGGGGGGRTSIEGLFTGKSSSSAELSSIS